MARMGGLPTEILLLIFERLCSHCVVTQRSPQLGIEAAHTQIRREELNNPGTRTLMSLCLACRRFCTVAQPILHHSCIPTAIYQYVCLEHKNYIPAQLEIPGLPYMFSQNTYEPAALSDPETGCYARLLRTVRQRPDLGKQMRHLTLIDMEPGGPVTWWVNSAATRPSADHRLHSDCVNMGVLHYRLLRSLHELSGPVTVHLMHILGWEDRWKCLLLSDLPSAPWPCPRIKLQMSNLLLYETVYLGPEARKGLQEVVSDVTDLEELAGPLWMSLGETKPDLRFLESLSLSDMRSFHADSAQLGPLLERLPRLKHFKLVFPTEHLVRNPSNRPQMSALDLYLAIRKRKDSLVTLEISGAVWEDLRTYSGAGQRVLGSFDDFASLEDVKIPAPMLLTTPDQRFDGYYGHGHVESVNLASLLPPNIKRLHITQRTRKPLLGYMLLGLAKAKKDNAHVLPQLGIIKRDLMRHWTLCQPLRSAHDCDESCTQDPIRRQSIRQITEAQKEAERMFPEIGVELESNYRDVDVYEREDLQYMA